MNDNILVIGNEELHHRVAKLELERDACLREAVISRQWYSPKTLASYGEVILTEIAIVVSDSDGADKHVEILNIDKADVWIGITRAGYLKTITMYDRFSDDYDEEVFDQPTTDGALRDSDTGRCFYGFLWMID